MEGINVGGIIGKLYNGTLTGTYTPEFSTNERNREQDSTTYFPG